MSRIGKQPVLLASGVEVVVTDGTVRVKGPKGELATRLVRNARIEIGEERCSQHHIPLNRGWATP